MTGLRQREARPLFARPMARFLVATAAVAFVFVAADALGAPRAAASQKAVKKLAELLSFTLIVGLALVMKSGAVAMALVFASLWPATTERCWSRIRNKPGRFFGIGLLNTIACGLILAALLHIGHRAGFFNFLALIFLILLGVPTVFGMSAVYGGLGRAMSGEARSRTSEILRGGAAFEAATLLPIPGLGVSFVVVVIAFGAGMVVLLGGLFARREPAQAPAEPDASEAPSAGPSEASKTQEDA